MADMDDRVALNYLLDFYGPLLTEHRREILTAYCEEDLSLQEMGEKLDPPISKSAVNHRMRRLMAIAEALNQSAVP